MVQAIQSGWMCPIEALGSSLNGLRPSNPFWGYHSPSKKW